MSHWICLTGNILGHAWPTSPGDKPGIGLHGDLHLDEENWIEG